MSEKESDSEMSPAVEGMEVDDLAVNTDNNDPYFLEECEYLRNEKRWLNRQRVLTLCSRGVAAQARHLMEDIKRILPHHKAESKWEKKQGMAEITELCSLRSCNNAVYIEQRRKDQIMWFAKLPLGPTIKCRLLNVHTSAEMRLTGNCLLYSRPLLIFGPEFETTPHLRLIKEAFMQIFGTPRNHPKSKPFFDHVIGFYYFDQKIFFRHYQITPIVTGDGGDANNPHRQTFVEIGPRFVLEPEKIFDGSFTGKVLWKSSSFVTTRDILHAKRLAKATAYSSRVFAKERRQKHLQKTAKSVPEKAATFEKVYGEENVF